MKLIFATNNEHKVVEVRSVVGSLFEILTLKETGIDIDIPEPYDTLEENARNKSQTIFELTKITEDYLIIEKMNFLRSGWFKFEIYENDILLEKNKFNIPKDDKIQ